jgi:outer membrane protein W
VLAGQSAIANAAPKVRTPLSINVGPSFLMDQKAKDAAGTTGAHVGATYIVGQTTLAQGQNSVDLDYDWFTGNGGKVSRLTPSFAYRHAFDAKAGGTVPYYGAGVGVNFTTVRVASGGTTTSNSTSQLGGKLLVGAQGDNGYYGEAVYMLGGTTHGANTNTIGFNLGYRF